MCHKCLLVFSTYVCDSFIYLESVHTLYKACFVYVSTVHFNNSHIPVSTPCEDTF